MSSFEHSLYPDHHYVETFGDDDEYERDENGNIIEEVEYVTVDLGVVEPTLVPSTSSYRLIVSPNLRTHTRLLTYSLSLRALTHRRPSCSYLGPFSKENTRLYLERNFCSQMHKACRCSI